MTEKKQEAVLMTAEEKARYEAFRKVQEKRSAEEKRKEERDVYRQPVSDAVDGVFPVLQEESKKLAGLKRDTYDRFRKALELKS